MSVELVPRLLEVWGKTAHALFAAHNISGTSWSIQAQYTVYMYVQSAEQDDGVLECNHSARVWEMPSIMGILRGSLRCNDDPVFL